MTTNINIDSQLDAMKSVQEQLDSLDSFLAKVKEIIGHLHTQTEKMAKSITSVSDEFCAEDTKRLIDAMVMKYMSIPSIALRKEYFDRADKLEIVTDIITRLDLLLFALRDELESK